MTAFLHVLTIFLHVAFAAAWFGLALSLPALTRGVLSSEGAAAAAQVGNRVMAMMGITIVLFYVFAVANFLLGGSVRVYGWPYHTAITLGLLLVVLQFVLIRPTWRKLAAAAGSPDAAVARGRLGMATGIGHGLWLGILVLMYLHRFGIGTVSALGLR